MKAVRLVSIILTLFFIGALVASAQVPPAPTNLTVQPTPNGVGALLNWQGSPGATGYKVYRAVDTSNHFQRIATVQSTTFTDWMLMPGRTYRYFVRAFNMSGESQPSNTVTFTPSPPVTGTIAGTVVDDSTALPIRGARIAFFRNINGGPVRTVFTDSLGQYSAMLDTGGYFVNACKMGYLCEWFDNTPTPSGATRILVAEGQTSTANFGLSQFAPPPHVTGAIAGTVMDDSTSLPIGGVRIRFYRQNSFMHPFETLTDSFGLYHAVLDTGIYFVQASKYGYRTEWYDNSPTIQNATPVPVLENATSTANFGLSPMAPPPPPVLVSVSGTVIDSVTNQPIRGAHVAIMRTIQGLNSIQHMNGMPGGFPEEIVDFPGFGRMHGVVWHGHTDSSGNYLGRVPAGHTYIVFSTAMGYINEFFNNKRNPAEADRLTLYNDTSGINFDLVPNPLFQNSIAGAVIDSMNNGVASRVVLFVRTNMGPRPVMHTVTDTTGNYIFRYVRTGVYLLKAIPISGYAPAWYKEGAFGVTDWHDADTVLASGVVTGINIGVIPISDAGFARISGRVTETNGSVIRAAFVYARSTTTGAILAYDITDDLGMFTLGYLVPGTYRVLVDREGYAQQSAPTYTLSASNNYEVTNASLQIVPSSPTSVGPGEGLPQRFVLYQNYPNPFNPSTAIRFWVPVQSHVTIRVLNILGQEVRTLASSNYGKGQYEIVWDGQNDIGLPVASGLYFYRLEAKPADGGEAYVGTMKMMLMK